MISLTDELKKNSYPGRGIVIGKSKDGKKAVLAYFIMGRSANSQNRIFEEDGKGIRTALFDRTKAEDTSLILYHPVRVIGNQTIVTNGDQTDTVFEGVGRGLPFEESLLSRFYEPDSPHFTPRISGILTFSDNDFHYQMNLIKKDAGAPEDCLRTTWHYDRPVNGEGHFLHTYREEKEPLPSFCGSPKAVAVSGTAEEFADAVWSSLNEKNRVSLFVRFIDLSDRTTETKIINRHQLIS